MKITMIAAMTPDRVIGSASGGVPWRGKVPRDQQHFRDYTKGKWLLLGRTTYEEMEGWFTSQVPVVLTSQTDYTPFESGHFVVSSIGAAIRLAKSSGAAELVVGGGAGVYGAVIDSANAINLTIVQTRVELDDARRFPEWNESEWSIVAEETYPSDEENEIPMVFRVLNRK